jgi:exonuclease VII large subunit
MTPRQPVELVFNVRCQFQLKHHQLGKNEKSTTVLSPLLVMSRGFFIARKHKENGGDGVRSAQRANPANERK